MIPVLRSIDSLLNRFDELSRCHTHFLSDFDTNFPDVKNPLHDVARPEKEQQKTSANILVVVEDNYDRKTSIGTIEDFHRRVIKSRYLHRPPSYSSNDSLSFPRVPSRTSSVTTDSTFLPLTSQIISETNTSQSIVSTSDIETKVKLTAKVKPKIAPQNTPVSRRSTRSTVTAFTMETVNRLSKPKIYRQVSNQKLFIKQTQRRSKTCGNAKKETSECSTALSNLPSRIKRTTTAINPAPKKLKVDHKIPLQIPKSIPMSTFSCPLVFHTPIPTIRLSFPMQQEQKSSRIVVFPKTTLPYKRSALHL